MTLDTLCSELQRAAERQLRAAFVSLREPDRVTLARAFDRESIAMTTAVGRTEQESAHFRRMVQRYVEGSTVLRDPHSATFQALSQCVASSVTLQRRLRWQASHERASPSGVSTRGIARAHAADE